MGVQMAPSILKTHQKIFGVPMGFPKGRAVWTLQKYGFENAGDSPVGQLAPPVLGEGPGEAPDGLCLKSIDY
jgi:hypothetical protein